MHDRKNISESISSRNMRTLEINSEFFGISLVQLMENAGRNIALEISARFAPAQKIFFFCGLGGNGGDGFVAARHLLSMGFHVSIALAGKAKDITHEAALSNWRALQSFREDIAVEEVTDSSQIPRVDADIIVDALLGTGAKGQLRPPIKQLVDHINSLNGFKIAVDVPTGVDSDTGEVVDSAVKADLTITFHRAKPGLYRAKKFVNELIVKSIGLPKELEKYAGPGDVFLVKKPRLPSAHKGDFGRLLVIGGSDVFSGAPALVSLGALRTGADIVYLAAPAKVARAVSSLSPDLITLKLEGEHLHPKNIPFLKPYLESVDAVVMGPGLGLQGSTQDFVKEFIIAVENVAKPLLLDADGLKAFAKFKRELNIPLVLTPHAGEYEILSGQKLTDKIPERVSEITKTAKMLGAVVVAKGQVDVICDKNRFKLNVTGNPGMTVGGTGDVLSGIIGALLAQKNDPFEAAVAGAFVNGAAGDLAAVDKGYHLLASDLLDYIPTIWEKPSCQIRVQNNGKLP